MGSQPATIPGGRGAATTVLPKFMLHRLALQPASGHDN